MLGGLIIENTIPMIDARGLIIEAFVPVVGDTIPATGASNLVIGDTTLVGGCHSQRSNNPVIEPPTPVALMAMLAVLVFT